MHFSCSMCIAHWTGTQVFFFLRWECYLFSEFILSNSCFCTIAKNSKFFFIPSATFRSLGLDIFKISGTQAVERDCQDRESVIILLLQTKVVRCYFLVFKYFTTFAKWLRHLLYGQKNLEDECYFHQIH